MAENYIHKKRSGRYIRLDDGFPEGIDICDYIAIKDELFIKSKYSSAENKLKYNRNKHKTETHKIINSYIED